MKRTILVTESAAANLLAVIRSLSLPADTRERVRASIAALAFFPHLGVPLPEPYAAHGLRFVLGPWRWMLIVYRVDEASGDVVIVAIEDARMASAVTSRPTHPAG